MNGTVTAKKIVGNVSGEGTLKGSVGALFGKEGDSAYEIAVHYGFEGTEAEWLESLHGEKGDPGIFLGSGDMPDGYSVQLDPNGDATTINEIAQLAIKLIPVYDGGFTDVPPYDGSFTKGAI